MICDEAAISMPDEIATILWFQAIISNREGDLSSERRFLEKAINTQPINRAAILAYGTLMLRLDQFDEAIKRFEDLIDIDSQESDFSFTQGACLRLSYCFHAQGKIPEAKSYLERVGPIFGRTPVKFDPLVTYDNLKLMIEKSRQ